MYCKKYSLGNYQCERWDLGLLLPLHYLAVFYLELSAAFVHLFKLCSEVLIGFPLFWGKIWSNKYFM